MENASSKVVFRLSHEENLRAMAQWLFMGVMNPDEIKHELYSTKVMEYREELRTIRSRSKGTSAGGGVFSGITASESMGGLASATEKFDPNAWNDSTADSSGDSRTWTESESESETDAPMLIPVMGKELAHVQFRSLEEQLFRAMAVLFDQQQRHGVARLVGMTAPVSIVTPTVHKMPSTVERTQHFLQCAYEKLKFALPSAMAQKQLADRASTFTDNLFREVADEPIAAKRRIR